ncbi:PREDICTED: uncharacterized protein LOC107345051 [Acropora digitifera]|uniref:uncharacterized protein LOC107345051 n=1 Tax=Acropora digitifera TaxID=70779 RepID=UPI00077A33DB|nr:PREDICTED: uncharacterized protein LOC107345051 [Acropora digitifera]
MAASDEWTSFSLNSSWYREKRRDEWSPKSQESDRGPFFDSDEKNNPSEGITVKDSIPERHVERESFAPLVPWYENSSFSRNSPSSSLDYLSEKSKVVKEESTIMQEHVAKSSNSLVVGKRPRAQGLKDIDLSRNLAAEYIREAREANKSPKKNKVAIPLLRHSSCPTFSHTNESSVVLSDRRNTTGKTGVTRNLSFQATSSSSSQSFRALIPYDNKIVRLFSCSDEQLRNSKLCTSEKLKNSDLLPNESSGGRRNADSSSRIIEVIDLTSCEETPDDKQEDLRNPPQSQLSGASLQGSHKLPSIDQSTMRRRVSKLTFSDDEECNSEEQYKDRGSVKSKQTAKADKGVSPRKNGKLFLKMGCIFTLGTILMCLYLHVNPHGFCLDSEFVKNISGIGDALKEKLYGQHIAQKIITVALQNHFNKNNARKPLVLSFHGWTGTGKNYVSSIITEHIFKHKMHSSFLHKFIVPLHFPHKSEVNTYNERIKQWIRGNILGMMGTIKDAILDFRGKSPSAGYQNMVFIFLSNSGGQAINEHVLRHIFDGKLRESLTLSELENLFYKMTRDTPDMWFADLVKEDVIDHIVPFLPLERMHIKQCIRKDLRNKGFNFKETIVTDVADQMEYFPPGHEFFSVSGCKKVSSRVDVTVG